MHNTKFANILKCFRIRLISYKTLTSITDIPCILKCCILLPWRPVRSPAPVFLGTPRDGFCSRDQSRQVWIKLINREKWGFLQGGAATCCEGFVKCFLRVPRLLGCTAAAMLPKQARGTFRKHITKPSEQVTAPGKGGCMR